LAKRVAPSQALDTRRGPCYFRTKRHGVYPTDVDREESMSAEPASPAAAAPADTAFRSAHFGLSDDLHKINADQFLALSAANLQYPRRMADVVLAATPEKANELRQEAAKEYETAVQSALQDTQAHAAKAYADYLARMREAWLSADLNTINAQLLFDLAQS